MIEGLCLFVFGLLLWFVNCKLKGMNDNIKKNCAEIYNEGKTFVKAYIAIN